MQLITTTGLGLFYGDQEVFSEVTVEITDRSRIGIVGPNGGGKTSLLRVLMGELPPNEGQVQRSRRLRVGYAPQSPATATEGTLRDEVTTAFAELQRLEEAQASTAERIRESAPGERSEAEGRYAALLERYEALGGYQYQSLVDRVAAGVGLGEAALGAPVVSASGGERTRASLAKALLADPDLLILDEPTNYLDFQALDWLESMLRRTNHAFIVVSHDRYFLDQVVNQVWDVEQHRLRSYPGNYSKYRVLKEERIVRQSKEHKIQQVYIAKEESFIQRYHAGQRSREARGRATRLERLERIEAPLEEATIALSGARASRTGQVVLYTHGLKIGHAGDQGPVHLLSVPDLQLERGSRTAIVGNNGSGKTTLLNTILGLYPALEGTSVLGHNVQVGYLRQDLADLPENASVMKALLAVKNMPLVEARSYLARFDFRGDEVSGRVSTLSGGERVRLALARLMIVEPNVLVLDEPTTHLDIPSREVVERVLLAFDGTLLLVSHDRRLLTLLADRLWLIEGGAVHPFEGGFEAWTSAKARAAGSSTVKRKPRTKPTAPATERQPSKARTEQVEKAILELETRLSELEQQLQEASERQGVAEIARLGKEYEEARARLEETWSKWAV
jgi:ATP-binding cassette subfamily F protein 3